MPLYEFECTECGYCGEDIIPSDLVNTLMDCPNCKAKSSFKRKITKLNLGTSDKPMGAVVKGKVVPGSFGK